MRTVADAVRTTCSPGKSTYEAVKPFGAVISNSIVHHISEPAAVLAEMVRVVAPDNKVSTRTVKLGDRIGSRAIVEDGLKPGERVVVEGAQVRDGTLVNAKPYTPPAPSTSSPAATGGK